MVASPLPAAAGGHPRRDPVATAGGRLEAVIVAGLLTSRPGTCGSGDSYWATGGAVGVPRHSASWERMHYRRQAVPRKLSYPGGTVRAPQPIQEGRTPC
jgi:hypothetical protein